MKLNKLGTLKKIYFILIIISVLSIFITIIMCSISKSLGDISIFVTGLLVLLTVLYSTYFDFITRKIRKKKKQEQDTKIHK